MKWSIISSLRNTILEVSVLVLLAIAQSVGQTTSDRDLVITAEARIGDDNQIEVSAKLFNRGVGAYSFLDDRESHGLSLEIVGENGDLLAKYPPAFDGGCITQLLMPGEGVEAKFVLSEEFDALLWRRLVAGKFEKMRVRWQPPGDIWFLSSEVVKTYHSSNLPLLAALQKNDNLMPFDRNLILDVSNLDWLRLNKVQSGSRVQFADTSDVHPSVIGPAQNNVNYQTTKNLKQAPTLQWIIPAILTSAMLVLFWLGAKRSH